MSAAPGLNDDFLDLLRALLDAEVDFVVVGAHAMAGVRPLRGPRRAAVGRAAPGSAGLSLLSRGQ